jgi:hypothetical protein
MQLEKAPTGGSKLCIWFLAILLIACQGVQTVEPRELISLLEGGPHAGTWESSDVVLTYQYVNQPGKIKLDIQGKAKRKYDQLSVWVLFLDAQGKTLETRTVFNTGYLAQTPSERPREGSIEKTFEVPMETNHLAFQSAAKAYSFGRP